MQARSGASVMGEKSSSAKQFIFLAAFVLLASGLNVAGSILSGGAGFPLYMDSFGTIAAAAVCGLAPLLAVAVLTNAALCTLGSHLVFKAARKRGEAQFSLDSFMVSGILSAVTNGISGSLFAAAYQYNLTAIEQGIYVATQNVILSNLAGGFLLNLVDKALASFIAYGMYLLATAKCARAWSNAAGGHRNEVRRLERQRNCGTPDPNEERDAPVLKIRPERIFLAVAVFSLWMSFGFKKCANDFFDAEYEKAASGGSYAVFEERFINSGFDSIAYTSFVLVAISVFIMQVKLNKRTNCIKVMNAQKETQKAFSRDLHDGVMQSLAALKICLSQDEHEKARAAADEAIFKTRELLGLSRMDLSGDFIALVRQSADVFKENYGIAVNVYEASDLAKRFSSHAAYEILNILQEALSNACRHSKASKIEIKVIDTSTDFIFSVCDNGCGFAPEAARKPVSHAGLQIMQERARALGGDISVKSDAGGTSVSLILPIQW